MVEEEEEEFPSSESEIDDIQFGERDGHSKEETNTENSPITHNIICIPKIYDDDFVRGNLSLQNQGQFHDLIKCDLKSSSQLHPKRAEETNIYTKQIT